MPYTELIDRGKLKPKQELKAIFERKGLALKGKQTVFTCGYGIAACVTELAWTLAGGSGQTSIYDGSWAEYVSNNISLLHSVVCLISYFFSTGPI